ncbi:hypothetical protein C2S53_011681 [Perilla frutescens var. hirtella]|uniref:Cytochrome P450 n=1 Tax=Perilla frutescens var. hirtella TaxID=608512 RepID=A0AAD4IVH5_PERFH|nr:hypothetical protein C2S53_011681 [Perilla frutescens var. hirtella]
MMELLVIIISLVLFTYTAVKLVRGNKKSSNVIPGPKKFPLIGNLHLLMGKSLPHHVFRELAVKHGGLMRLQLGQVPFLIVSSVEVAKQVYRTHDITFSNRFPTLVASMLSYNYKDVAVAPYGEHWRQVRKVCTLELLSARRVKSFRPIREEENLNFAKSIAAAAATGSPVNLSEKLRVNFFDIITRSSVGDKSEEKEKFTQAMDETLKLSSGLSSVDLFPSLRFLPVITGIKFKLKRIFWLTDGILQRIIDRHRIADDGRSEDLVDVLLKYQRTDAEFHLTDDDIKAVILDMFFGGSETSATTVGWAMSEMVKNPRTLKRAQDEVRQVFDSKNSSYVDEAKFGELKYLKLVIDETLRMHPALPLLVPRMSSERCEINGYEIPANTRVLINAWAMGRDPKYWNDAEKFIPERFEDTSIDYKGNHFEYVPFGSGRRICPGISMGLTNVEFTLATLLYHFDWEMPSGIKNEALDMTEAFGVTAARKHDLLLFPTLARALPTTFNR